MEPALDLTDLDRFAHGFPHETFATLRRDHPVWFHPSPNGSRDRGFWVITRHAHCAAIAGDVDTFAPLETTLERADEPRHQLFRRLLMPALSPSAMRGIEDELHWHVERIVRSAMKKKRCDVVLDLADPVSLHAIARVLGVPVADQDRWFAWLEAAFSVDDVTDTGPATSSSELLAYGQRLIEAKRKHPGADLLSKLLHAHLDTDDGPSDAARLAPNEVLSFFQLLGSGGAETSRNAISHGILALAEHPEEWNALRANHALLRRATEEILRWSTPTSFDRRVAARASKIEGHSIKRGDTLTLWWASANRDERVFEAPFRFDIRREPNPHLAFGHGTHGCLGGTLARMAIRLLLDVLVEHCDHVELAGPADWIRSDRRAGLRALPVILHRART